MESGHWSDFFVAEVGAAAALCGLLMVAISINLQRILSFPQLPGRAAETLIMLVGVLLACSVGLIPNQAPRALGAELLVIGLMMSLAPLTIQVRSWIEVKGQPISWRLPRLFVHQITSLPVIVGGLMLLIGVGDGLYAVAAGVLISLAASVWNSWILLIEILR